MESWSIIYYILQNEYCILKSPSRGYFLFGQKEGDIAKKKRKKKGAAKPPPVPIKYEDTSKFDAFNHMMWSNRGINGPM